MISPAASRDIDDILQYSIEQWGIEQAEAYGRSLERALEQIRMFPLIGSPRTEGTKEFRVFPVEQHLVFYALAAEYVQIVRILHRRTDWTLSE